MSYIVSEKISERVNVCEPHVQSRAAYMLLVSCLRNQDRRYDWKRNLHFRKRFLDSFKKKHGDLYCEYCGKRPLIYDGIGKEVKTFLATLDHVVPLSRGGIPFERSNIKVCCPQCNTKKGDHTDKEFIE